MSGGTLARGLSASANALLAASLFFVLIWWWVSTTLFVSGVLLYGGAWLVGRLQRTPSLQATAPDCLQS